MEKMMRAVSHEFYTSSRRTMQDEIDELRRARAVKVLLILGLLAWSLVSTVKLIDARQELSSVRMKCEDTLNMVSRP
jgi:hypothetical protein